MNDTDRSDPPIDTPLIEAIVSAALHFAPEYHARPSCVRVELTNVERNGARCWGARAAFEGQLVSVNATDGMGNTMGGLEEVPEHATPLAALTALAARCGRLLVKRRDALSAAASSVDRPLTVFAVRGVAL